MVLLPPPAASDTAASVAAAAKEKAATTTTTPAPRATAAHARAAAPIMPVPPALVDQSAPGSALGSSAAYPEAVASAGGRALWLQLQLC